MIAGRSDRRPVRIRRRGRHTTPSQVEKVAQQAGKAAPAFAIAGALVAVPQASHALAGSAGPVTAAAPGQVPVPPAKPARHAATTHSTYYSVRSGDTLSKIADGYYHNAGDWQYLY